VILQGLKPRSFDRLNKPGRKWLQELLAVMWSLRTTPSRATGLTMFFLVYGAKAVLPTDLEYGSPRVKGYDEGANQKPARTRWTDWTRHAPWPWCTQQGTSRR
jgi:hypothetical protein